VRLLAEGPYQAGSWEKKRRVVYKAEAMAEGTNTRFVVTNKAERSLRNSTTATWDGARPRIA
jgi:Transposase DDE domain group 1